MKKISLHKKRYTEKKRRRRQKGGKDGVNGEEGEDTIKMRDGYIDTMKEKIAFSLAKLMNTMVTKQVEKIVLRCVPPDARQRISESVEETTNKMVIDISKKVMDAGINMVKATPAVGNAFSVASAVDNLVAGIRNTKASVDNILAEINDAQGQLDNMTSVVPTTENIPSVDAMTLPTEQTPVAIPVAPAPVATPVAPAPVATPVPQMQGGGTRKKVRKMLKRTHNSIKNFYKTNKYSR